MTLKEKLDINDTALIVVDIQNDFCAPSGVMASRGKDVSKMDKLVHDIHSLVTICESVGIPVFYTLQIYDRNHLNELQKEQYDLDKKLVTCDINGEGWKIYKLHPNEDQIYIKYSYNIFSNEKLKRDLEFAEIKTLIITGVSTQICVETAIRNGFDLGYKIVVPEDLIATTSKDSETQQRTLNLLRKTYGVVSSRQEIIETITSFA